MAVPAAIAIILISTAEQQSHLGGQKRGIISLTKNKSKKPKSEEAM
jgi:hypothetical protein